MKRLISLALIAVILLAGVGVAMAQQYQNGYQNGGQQSPQTGNTLNLPPAPPKTQPNMEYGNTKRAAILGERLTDASQGNAKVTINEGKVIVTKIYLNKDASPYDLAGTMANLTYMMADLYGITELDKSNIEMIVYDTSGSQIIDSLFNVDKNAFDYYKIPENAMPSQQQNGQQGMQQGPAYGQGGMSRGMGMGRTAQMG